MAAFRATNYWREMLRRIEGSRTIATSTVPKMKPIAPTVDAHIHHHQHAKQPMSATLKTEFAPIYVTLGMVVVAVMFGVHTAKQQLVYSPSVQVSKKKREIIPEVEEPDHVAMKADKFINKSFLRKVAHIQDSSDPARHTVPNSIRGDIYARPRQTESLKSVGVNPKQY